MIIEHTSAYWVANNPVINLGDEGKESDTGLSKLGDGNTAWNNLAYYEPVSEFSLISGTDTYTADSKINSILGLFVGLRIRGLVANANTGASTLNFNSFGAIPIKKNVSSALSAGDLAAGGVYDFTYDGTNFQVTIASGSGGGVPTTRTLTINGSAQDLSADRTWTIVVTGTANKIDVSGGSGLAPTITISPTYVGQTSITTLGDRKSTRLNSSHVSESRMPSSA